MTYPYEVPNHSPKVTKPKNACHSKVTTLNWNPHEAPGQNSGWLTSTILLTKVWKSPDVAETNAVAEKGHEELDCH